MSKLVSRLMSVVSTAKTYILYALAGILLAGLVSVLVVPNTQQIEASAVPVLLFYEWPEPLCGAGCSVVACRDNCDYYLVSMGHDCCNAGVEETFSCLYCGP